MSDKRKKRKFAAKREQRRLNRLAHEGRIANGSEVPVGAVLADKSQQVPNNSYSPPPEFYVDIEFTCRDCGRQEVWPAKQQKWYYEVAKGSLYAIAVRCGDCRHKLKERNTPGKKGDPNPIKNLSTLLKHLQRELGPALADAGFTFDGKRKWNLFGEGEAWLDYNTTSCLLRIRYERGWQTVRLVLDALDDESGYRAAVITDMNAPRSNEELLARLAEFKSGVLVFLAGLRSDSGLPRHSVAP